MRTRFHVKSRLSLWSCAKSLIKCSFVTWANTSACSCSSTVLSVLFACRQFFEVLAARITIETCDLGRIEPRHPRGTRPSTDGRPTQQGRSSAGLEAGGLPSGGHLAPAPNLATHVPWPRSQEPSRAQNPLRDHGPPGGGSVRSSSGCRHAALQSHRDGHAVRRLEACIASGAFARRKASSDAERRTRVHHQGASARDEAEKISGRRPCSLAEGLGRQGQGPRKRETLRQGEGTPASQRPVQRKVQRQGQSFRGESLSSVGGSSSEVPPISTRWWRPWRVLTRWRARLPLMLTFLKVSTPRPQWVRQQKALVLVPSGESVAPQKKGYVGGYLAAGLGRNWLSFVVGRGSGIARYGFGCSRISFLGAGKCHPRPRALWQPGA